MVMCKTNDVVIKLLGHFGVTELAATVLNPYFIDEVVRFLNLKCHGCLNPRENVKNEERYILAPSEHLHHLHERVLSGPVEVEVDNEVHRRQESEVRVEEAVVPLTSSGARAARMANARSLAVGSGGGHGMGFQGSKLERGAAAGEICLF
ncbi:hypothetical protein EJB05_12728 [Eragrostis curvula]|uniref:Uncharacterized protein n=1 Tax=Eragrostis curvula TaxID=38414 RepID=A0A5J9VUQ3_9POAL|nr:hypothetical protein EJB05_12728 [Eragrostis curvula]